jgi:Ni,Fe-hydrogenase I large subunit
LGEDQERQDCQISGDHADKLERLSARFFWSPGHWEESFIGLEIKDLDNPIELCHVVRSHDACLVCTVHFVKSGKKRTFLV